MLNFGTCQCWFKKFTEGSVNLPDEDRSRRTVKFNVRSVRKLIWNYIQVPALIKYQEHFNEWILNIILLRLIIFLPFLNHLKSQYLTLREPNNFQNFPVPSLSQLSRTYIVNISDISNILIQLIINRNNGTNPLLIFIKFLSTYYYLLTISND